MSVKFAADIGETIGTIGQKLIPSWISFVIQLTSFLILLLVVFFIAYKPVKKMLKKRADYIENEISAFFEHFLHGFISDEENHS